MTPNVEFLKVEFREFCVSHLTLRWIEDVFSAAGFTKPESSTTIGSERRGFVKDYYAAVDWNDLEIIRKFLKVLENTLLLSILSKDEKDQLRSICEKAGFEVDGNGHTVHLTTKGVGKHFKNLIFAADGPKPEIVLSDSVSNDIQIVKNEEFCLVYDRPIQTHGLLWKELVDWWKDVNKQPDLPDIDAGRKLYSRLEKSLTTPPEKLFWKVYFKVFYARFGEKLPALIPQVYLHYDPYTIKQLGGEKRLPRQRMDFLLLLSDRIRIVIEVDGKQHYSNGDISSPRLYAELVAEDRKLKLAGYEVYRFSGYELDNERTSENTISQFVENLFKRHEIG